MLKYHMLLNFVVLVTLLLITVILQRLSENLAGKLSTVSKKCVEIVGISRRIIKIVIKMNDLMFKILYTIDYQ